MKAPPPWTLFTLMMGGGMALLGCIAGCESTPDAPTPDNTQAVSHTPETSHGSTGHQHTQASSVAGHPISSTSPPDPGSTPHSRPDTAHRSPSAAHVRPKPNRVKVYVLAGQSNMNGHGFLERLPKPWTPSQPELPVRIHWERSSRRWDAGKLHTLEPLGPASLLPRRFGPELSLGERLAERHPDVPIVLLKYAMHWTNLHRDWRPGPKGQGTMYRRMLHIVHQGLHAIREEGNEPELVAMFWMQGERDAAEQYSAQHYRTNLERFIHRVRDDLDAPHMTVVVGQIAGPRLPWRTQVREAQAEVARTVPGVVLVDTERLPLQFDRLHYTAQGQWTLGEQFAAALEDGRTP
ncbi:MAG: sialate O-acetylesterase [Myxococcota bacterium]